MTRSVLLFVVGCAILACAVFLVGQFLLVNEEDPYGIERATALVHSLREQSGEGRQPSDEPAISDRLVVTSADPEAAIRTVVERIREMQRDR